MNGLLLAGWLLALGAPPDTTVALRRGDRVVVQNLSGSVEVQAWDRPELAVEGWGEELVNLGVERSGERLLVGSTDRKGRGLDVEVRLRVPPWASLEIRGRELDVTVTGTQSDLQVHTVEGTITASRVSGVVTLTTVDGEILVEDATGKVSARSRGEDVTLRRVRGDVEAHSGSGDVVLEEMAASSLRAETLDGDMRFEGSLSRSGSYWFSVHDGDADLTFPAGTGATVRVATFDGEFTSDFPVTLQGYGGGGVFDFVLGDGGAKLEIQVFDGEIHLFQAAGRGVRR